MERFDVVGRINSLMNRKEWSVYELANRSGITNSTIYNWAQGKSTPSLENVCLLCEAFDITLEQFFATSTQNERTIEEQYYLSQFSVLNDKQKRLIQNVLDYFKN